MSSSPDALILSNDIDTVNVTENITLSESQETELSASESSITDKTGSIPINGSFNDRSTMNKRTSLLNDSDFRISRSLGDSGAQETVIDEKILMGLKNQGSSLDEKQILKEEKKRQIGATESSLALQSQLDFTKKQLLLEIKRRKLAEGKISKRVFYFFSLFSHFLKQDALILKLKEKLSLKNTNNSSSLSVDTKSANSNMDQIFDETLKKLAESDFTDEKVFFLTNVKNSY